MKTQRRLLVHALALVVTIGQWFAMTSTAHAACDPNGSQPCDENGDPDLESGGHRQPRCPLEWFCDDTTQYYASRRACSAACGSACYLDFYCNPQFNCYCP
jgi:hypothetical protein